jgi:hypothetical protein
LGAAPHLNTERDWDAGRTVIFRQRKDGLAVRGFDPEGIARRRALPKDPTLTGDRSTRHPDLPVDWSKQCLHRHIEESHRSKRLGLDSSNLFDLLDADLCVEAEAR